jgi:hypothetical protein
MRTPLVGTRVKPVPAKTEGDRAAANRVASVRLGGDGDISRLTQCTILTAAADKPEGPCEGHAETAPAGPTRPTADEGAPVNAYADRTLASINERLISLAGYEMHVRGDKCRQRNQRRDYADRHATTSVGHRHTRLASGGGQTHRQAVEGSGCSE